MHGRRYSDIILQRRENRSGLIPHHALLRQTLNNRQESPVQTEMSIPIVNHLAGKQLKDWCTFFSLKIAPKENQQAHMHIESFNYQMRVILLAAKGDPSLRQL